MTNLPVPVLAEPMPETTATKSGGEAREGTRVRSDIPMAASHPVKVFEPLKSDSRGGQNLSTWLGDDNGINDWMWPGEEPE